MKRRDLRKIKRMIERAQRVEVVEERLSDLPLLQARADQANDSRCNECGGIFKHADNCPHVADS